MRTWGALVSIVLLGATLSPIRHDPRQREDDDFPLSTYPMFASPRSTRLTLDYVVAWTARGERWHVPPPSIGSSEVLQANRIIQRAIAGGPEAMLQLCRRIASRVPAVRPDVVVVTLVRGDHDAVELLAHGVRGDEREHVRCEVTR